MRSDRPPPFTMTVEEAARRLGIGRTLAYDLARRDRLPVPVLRLGRRLVVPRPALERVLAGEARTDPGAEEMRGARPPASPPASSPPEPLGGSRPPVREEGRQRGQP